jgi:hypothetical protein
MSREVTILGMGRSATERRWNIHEYCIGEVWGLNNGYAYFPTLKGKWSRFYELHNYEYLKTWKAGSNIPNHFAALDQLGCNIHVTQILPLIRVQKMHETLKYCRHFDTNYWLGSPSMMLMELLYEHDHGNPVDTICAWGIDTIDETHLQQRASWSWWVAMAHARGIKFHGSIEAYQHIEETDEGLKGFRGLIGKEMLRLEAAEKIKKPSKAKKKNGGKRK